MAAKKAAQQRVYVARDSGHTLVNGVEMPYHRDRTRVAADHPLAKHPDFVPADEHFHYEQATDAPAEGRDVEVEPEVDEAALEYQTVVELRKQADELGVKHSGLNKADLVAAIAAAQNEEE